MSEQRDRHRGKLFGNRDKKKPSQPDMQGDGYVGGKTYDISAWEREDQLVVSFTPPRSGTNKYPPEEFRGSLDRGRKNKGGGSMPTWAGDIAGDDGSYAVRAYEKQGKSGAYLTLEFEATVASAPE